MKNRWMILIALLATLGLVAAACSDDDEEGSETTDTEAPESTEAADEGEEEPESTEAPEEEEPEEEIVLTDSFRGVTADTILLGHSSIDFDTLNNDFGLDLAFEDFRPQMDAIVAFYNEQGGVLGRQMEVVHEVFVPVGPTTAEAACLALTEDVEVFAVINGFQGPGAEDVNECITELHDTILVGNTAPRTDQAEAASGLWVSPQMSIERRNEAAVQLMADAGVLEELGTVMIIGANPEEQPLVESAAAAFEAAGTEVPVAVWITTTGDESATQAEVEVFLERGRTEGVTSVFLIGAGEFRNAALFTQAPELTYVLSNGDQNSDWQSIPPVALQEGTRVLTNTNGNLEIEDPLIQECIEVVEEAQGVEVIPTWELPEGDPNYWSGTLGACRRMAVFVQIAEAAGPDLTNESWAAALDEVPDLAVPGFQFSSLNGDKVDARDSLVLVEYDLPTLTFVPLSEAIDVG